MNRVSPAIARHYARALLDVALQQGNAEALRAELRGAVGLLSEQPELARVLGNPVLPPSRKRDVVLAVWAEDKASPLFRKLLGLLAENGRLGALSAIDSAFGSLWNAHRHIASAEVVSAVPLEEEQQRALGGALERATGMGVEMETRLDPAVLGGVLVRVGGRSYDGTVRARLRALKERLASGA
jgi:F-type H+-transporting ATPase subunit delta